MRFARTARLFGGLIIFFGALFGMLFRIAVGDFWPLCLMGAATAGALLLVVGLDDFIDDDQ